MDKKHYHLSPFKLAMSYFDEQLLNGVMGHRILREKGCH
jgi:hypothetical protein